MTQFTETFRGDVWPKEVDATEHFTVAYYYEKFEAAAWRFLKRAGIDPAKARTTAALTNYKAELRNRDIYRVETGLIVSGDTPVLGHRLINAETETLCTAMQQKLVDVSLNGPTAEWDGNPWENRSIPGDDAGWIPSSVNIVRPDEANWAGKLSLAGYIHRFSTANSFVMAAFGMTSDYLNRSRVGLSTFEFQLTFHSEAQPGDMIDVESCIAHLGGSSMRFFHRMRNASTGTEIANLSQFGVHLDLDARRPSRIPDDLRERAHALLAKG